MNTEIEKSAPEKSAEQEGVIARAREIIDSVKERLATHFGGNRTSLEENVGDAIAHIAKRTKEQSLADGTITPDEAKQISETSTATVLQGVEEGELGIPINKNPIEQMVIDGHEAEVIDAVAEVAIEDQEIAMEAVVIVERSDKLNEVYNQLSQLRPELNFDDPTISELLSNKAITDTLGLDIIGQILDYDSAAISRIFDMTEAGQLEDVKSWVAFLHKLGIDSLSDSKITHYAILSYSEATASLARQLSMSDGQLLSDTAKRSLTQTLLTENKFNASSLNDLEHYTELRKKGLQEAFKSNSPHEVYNAITEGLFGVPSPQLKSMLAECFPNIAERPDNPLGITIIKLGKLDAVSMKEYIARYGLDDADRIAILQALNLANTYQNIRTKQPDERADYLRFQYDSDMQPNSAKAYDIFAVREKVQQIITKQYKEALLYYNPEETSHDIEHFTVQGLSGEPIQVNYVNGIPFKLLIHKIHCFDTSQKTIASRLSEQPALWDNAEGSSTISTSLISEDKIDFVGSAEPDEDLRPINNVYYGFSQIESDSILFMGPGDLYTRNGKGILEPSADRQTAAFMTPYDLQHATPRGRYNEIVLDRKSHSNNKARIRPSSIICFGDGPAGINVASKRAAEYFGIPINLINRQTYQKSAGYLK